MESTDEISVPDKMEELTKSEDSSENGEGSDEEDDLSLEDSSGDSSENDEDSDEEDVNEDNVDDDDDRDSSDDSDSGMRGSGKDDGNCEQDEMDVVPCTEDEDSSSLEDLPLLSGKRKLQGLSTTPAKRRCRNSSKEKVNQILQRLKANCRLADDETKTAVGEGSSAGSHAHPSGQPTPSLKSGTSSETFITRCKAVVMELKKMFRDNTQLHDLPRVKAWREELEKIDREVCLPKTTIAVVGETGAGKSSMLNALFDQSSLLPTSGMRACTAVVVEVSENCDNSNYEADIKFLSRKASFNIHSSNYMYGADTQFLSEQASFNIHSSNYGADTQFLSEQASFNIHSSNYGADTQFLSEQASFNIHSSNYGADIQFLSEQASFNIHSSNYGADIQFLSEQATFNIHSSNYGADIQCLSGQASFNIQ
ncbi:uncharacterized protein LOC121388425 [Gigantopelta aegis]|uniref:uncharacterized protein LOC121388425 n=1 Tax=Gigantopelta aegis TaxID=1735272 RepID=UPI001B88807C|nr:uncharacterized protein LOC121388425 [Gigantopelta aegis]